jgi:hypothetical protein
MQHWVSAQICPEGHVPQLMVPPQPSAIGPQPPENAAHVFGVQHVVGIEQSVLGGQIWGVPVALVVHTWPLGQPPQFLRAPHWVVMIPHWVPPMPHWVSCRHSDARLTISS